MIAYTFTNKFFDRMFHEATKIAITRDAYSKLCEFEHLMTKHFQEHVLNDLERLEYHRCLAVINCAQIQILERKLGVDLDNDGRIGGK